MKFRPVALIVLLLLSATGCGPTLAAFIAEADALCKRGEAAITSLAAPDSVAKVKEFGEKLAAETKKLVNQLAALKPPRGDDAAKTKAFVDDLRAAGNASEELGKAAGKEDFPGTEKAVADTDKAFKKADDSARTAGFKVCGKAGAAAAASVAAPTPGLLKNAYIAKADALCGTANNEQNAIPQPESLEEYANFIDKILVITDKLTTDLKAIAPPAADKAAIDEWLAANDALRAVVVDLQAAARAGDEDRFLEVLDRFTAMSNDALLKGDRIGFRDCGSAGANAQ
ncbi:MAG TPA: hypothetical protein VND22_08735 [Actinomycetota bacterium]|nr:hypothetical protein [Actinomycetota bacterium]